MTHPFADLLERSRKPSRTRRGPDVRDERRLDRRRRLPDDGAGGRGRGRAAALPRARARPRGEAAGDRPRRRSTSAASPSCTSMIGEAFAAACLATLEEAGLSPEDVDLIGSHGQTIYHHSGVAGAIRATLQVGDGDVIAVRTGCYVVSDFRARDIAAGGEGAPLSPIADTVLFGRRRRRAAAAVAGRS